MCLVIIHDTSLVLLIAFASTARYLSHLACLVSMLSSLKLCYISTLLPFLFLEKYSTDSADFFRNISAEKWLCVIRRRERGFLKAVSPSWAHVKVVVRLSLSLGVTASRGKLCGDASMAQDVSELYLNGGKTNRNGDGMSRTER